MVARIKATPPNRAMFIPATASLADLLRDAPPADPDFDVEAWNWEWAVVEAEIKAMDRTEDVAEGRG